MAMDTFAARSIAIQFEAMLIERMIAPLESAFGESGAMLTAPLAQSIAERQQSGFATVLSTLLERGQ
jgi:hypothetical protein